MRKIAWSERARTDVRRIDRAAAMRIFNAIQRFAETTGPPLACVSKRHGYFSVTSFSTSSE